MRVCLELNDGAGAELEPVCAGALVSRLEDAESIMNVDLSVTWRWRALALLKEWYISYSLEVKLIF